MSQGLGSFSSGPGILEIFEEQWGNHARQELVTPLGAERSSQTQDTTCTTKCN